jgi:acyl-CoA synthetase (AMP-forming)/AMP-acid ligase II/acetyltransferase-like isoleucine patch superfamily enzyme
MIFTPDSSKPYRQPAAPTLHDLLAARVRISPEAGAIAAPGRRPLSYSCLLNQVQTTVQTLRDFGLKRNDRVAVVLPNGPEMAVAFVAIASGATCAPLNPAYRSNEFDFYLSDLNAKALIIWSEMESPAREIAGQRGIPIIELTIDRNDPAGVFRLSGPSQETSASDNELAQTGDTALVLHTSGTTSRPKIVLLTHGNLCASGHHISVTLGLNDRDRCLNVMPLFHIHGLMAAVVASLSTGASVSCTPGLDPERFFQWIDVEQPTWYTAVPTMHQAILSKAGANSEVISRRPLRFIRSSSASLPPPVLMELERVFGSPVVEAYGMTEASHQMTSNPLPPLSRKPGSVGLASGPDVAIMDEAGALLPTGQIGEVVIRGRNVTAGYENNPTANKCSFTNGWFRTGDQGRFDDEGYLYLTGRLKEMINRGGEKIAPREIDEVLGDHPAVAQAIAFAVPHPTLGEDVAAAVVLKPGATALESDLVGFASSRLADFKVPRRLLIIKEIPKGPTGKLQRIGLAEKLADQLAAKQDAEFVAPESSIEQQISEIWREVLKVDRVGVRDNFYALGGDSLAMAVMVSVVEDRFGASIPIDGLLTAPTVETIVALVGAKKTTDASASAEPSRTSGLIRDTFVGGLKNRLFQYLALYSPGYKSTRVWLHRMRGVSIGRNVSIGLSALIETAYPSLVHIGNDVSIGMRAIIIAHLRDSTSQARMSGRHTVRIEDGAYIGPGVIILPNVTIGEGAVVSAGSVVSRSIPPRTLARGNPAAPVARCGVSLGGGVSYEEFLRHLSPIKDGGAI